LSKAAENAIIVSGICLPGKVTVWRAGQEETPDQHAEQSPCQCVVPEDVLIQLVPS
jgi:hypothetical protein